MMFKTEDEAVRSAESMAQAACGASAAISYRVYRCDDGYRVTGGEAPRSGPRMKRCPLVAWFESDGQRVKRLLVGR